MWAAAQGRERGDDVYMGIKRHLLFALLKEPAQAGFVSIRHFCLTLLPQKQVGMRLDCYLNTFPLVDSDILYPAAGFFICCLDFTRLQFDVTINPSCVLLTSLVQHLLIEYLAED